MAVCLLVVEYLRLVVEYLERLRKRIAECCLTRALFAHCTHIAQAQVPALRTKMLPSASPFPLAPTPAAWPSDVQTSECVPADSAMMRCRLCKFQAPHRDCELLSQETWMLLNKFEILGVDYSSPPCIFMTLTSNATRARARPPPPTHTHTQTRWMYKSTLVVAWSQNCTIVVWSLNDC